MQNSLCLQHVSTRPLHRQNSPYLTPGSTWPQGGVVRRSLRCRAVTSSRLTTRDAVREVHDPPHYIEAAAYLKSLGFQQASEVARVLDIAMNPNSIYLQNKHKRRSVNVSARQLSVQQDLEPVCDFLQSQGLSPEQVATVLLQSVFACQVSEAVGDKCHSGKVITKHPPVLSYSVEGRLKPFWSFLAEIGVPDPMRTVLARPTLLGLDADKNLRAIVGYLQANGNSTEDICHMLETSI